MNPDELRALADALLPMAAAPCFDGIDIERAAAYLRAQADAQPVAWMWQHDETGRIGFVDQYQVEAGWQELNPRCELVQKLYAHPAPAVPQAEPKREPLGDWRIAEEAKSRSMGEAGEDAFYDGVRWAESAHGIGGSNAE